MSRIDLSLYLITDQRAAAGRDQVELVAAAIAGGVTVVQLRAKDASGADQVQLGRRLRDLTRATRTTLIVNDRVDLALALEADGVHLGQDDLPPSVARRLLGGRIVGVSVGSPSEYGLVEREGADYIGTGPFAATASKDDAGTAIGAAGVAAVRRVAAEPMVAIGGIDLTNAAAAVVAGADGVAVIRAILGAPDPEAAARALRQSVDAARRR